MVNFFSISLPSFFQMRMNEGTDTLDTEKKYSALIAALKDFNCAGVAFSGGVDSTLLLYAACEAIGKEQVFVLRGLSELLSQREKESAAKILDELKIDKKMRLEIELHPLIWPEFIANTPERCYFCKKRMYQTFLRQLEKNDCTVLLDGSNVGDLKSCRPGFRAIHELGVKTPLLDAGLNKEEIRSLAEMYQLNNHDKPSNSCLATRLVEGTHLEKEKLSLVEKYEEFLLSRNFTGCRVKPDKKNIIIQATGKDIERLAVSSVRIEIIHFFQSEGFKRVLVDLKPRG